MTTNSFQTDFDRVQHQKRINTLTHVMNLFEERSKYLPVPMTGPLPIKANGAVVVNRPSKQIGSIRSLPNYLEDDDTDEEADLGDSPIIKNEINLVHGENKRLRQQILIEREQYENWRLSQEKLSQELSFAQNTNKNLQRMNDRFQKLILPKEKRRQSTGVTFDDNQVISSYERKIQILLNEIDAMEIQENESLNHLTVQKNKCEKLIRKLKYKDDIIRQLAYDLQFERNHL